MMNRFVDGNRIVENRVSQRDIVEDTLGGETDDRFVDAVGDINKSVLYAKKILMANKVQNFTSADVCALAALIVGRVA